MPVFTNYINTTDCTTEENRKTQSYCFPFALFPFLYVCIMHMISRTARRRATRLAFILRNIKLLHAVQKIFGDTVQVRQTPRWRLSRVLLSLRSGPPLVRCPAGLLAKLISQLQIRRRNCKSNISAFSLCSRSPGLLKGIEAPRTAQIFTSFLALRLSLTSLLFSFPPRR